MGQICPARGLGGRQLSLDWHFDQWEFCLGEIKITFFSFLCEESRGAWVQSGVVAGVEERLRPVRG